MYYFVQITSCYISAGFIYDDIDDAFFPLGRLAERSHLKGALLAVLLFTNINYKHLQPRINLLIDWQRPLFQISCRYFITAS